MQTVFVVFVTKRQSHECDVRRLVSLPSERTAELRRSGVMGDLLDRPKVQVEAFGGSTQGNFFDEDRVTPCEIPGDPKLPDAVQGLES